MAQVPTKENFIIDSGQEQGFISVYKKLPEKLGTVVRFFDRGEFYTCYGDDALLAAKEIFKTSSVVRYIGGSSQIPAVSLSRLNFESFSRELLLVKHYRVEVYKQQSSSKNDWSIAFKASPGNLLQFEEILFGPNSEQTTQTGVIAVKVVPDTGQKLVGVAYVSIDAQSILVSEFHDADTFLNLEALIVQLAPRECLVHSGDLTGDNSKLKEVLTRSNLLITEEKKTNFTNKDIVQDLTHLLKSKGKATSVVSARPELDKSSAMASLAAVIKYLDLLSDTSNYNQYSLSSYDLSQFMRLDSAALRALHVFPDSRDDMPSLNKNVSTLYGLLSKCRTASGHRLLAQWLRQPLVDKNKIEERLDLVETLMSSVELRHSLGEDHLRRFPDIQKLCRKLVRKSSNLQDLYRLYQCIVQLPLMCEAFALYEGVHKSVIEAAVLVPLQEIINDLTKFQEMIETTVDLDLASQGEFIIKCDFDDALKELRDQIKSLEKDFQVQQKKVASDLHLEAGKSLKLESNSQLGYFFRITLKEEKILRNNRAYSVIDTNKSGVRFRNVAMQELNEQYLNSKDEYAQQQKSVVDEIITIAAGYVDILVHLGNVIAEIDCIYALSAAATSAPVQFVRPEILSSESQLICLKNCRHPCLELQDTVSFIPNDCILSKEDGIFHIITGPNMGGKSTYLRSVGISVLLAQIGSFVPCDTARISIRDSIMARVGAGDCQLKGVSTFMAEMIETSTILKCATNMSFIIIDELGRGTSTYDGFGLAWSISEYIVKSIGAFCLFATHFHELTNIVDDLPQVRNFHVSATTAYGALTLLYQVKPGACDRSFGIHVAELAHFPASIIESAKRKAEELEDTFALENDEAIEDRRKMLKTVKEEGEKTIDEFLRQVSVLDDSLPENVLQQKVKDLKQGVLSCSNAYVRHLIGTCI